ncbi:MAG: aldo/keto reductase [Chloroflexi bacterium]|nr:aldo/keto reductase [Chloroflexota bacterium]
MRTRKLGKNGPEVSVLGFGAWPIAGKLGPVEEGDAVSAIQRAVDGGVTLIDTAEAYGFGLSEELVAKAVGSRRDQVFIATKVLPENWRRDDLLAAAERSLRHLHTDYIDLYQIHWPSDEMIFTESMQAIDDLIQQGKVRYAGVSNFSAAQMHECLKVRHVDSDQPRYNLLDREIEAEVLPFCQEQGIGVLAYAPLGQGLLTGSYEEDHVFGADDIRSQNERFMGEKFKRTIRMAKQLAAYAADHGHTLIELDIAWVLAHPAMTTALVGAKSPAQVEGWLGAGDWELTPQQLQEIDEIVASAGL